MVLCNFHRVLISAALVFDFGFVFWTIRQYRPTADAVQLVMAIGLSAVTVALVAYLVYFNRNLTVLRHVLLGRCKECGYDLRRRISQDGCCPVCGAAIGPQWRQTMPS